MRPADDESCAVCIENLRECHAGDINERNPDDERTHLQFMYDRRVATHCYGMTDEEIAKHLRNYALDRMLAPFRDNLNKKRGKAADRTYESRNMKSARATGNMCGEPGPRGVRCIRTAGHEGSHRY